MYTNENTGEMWPEADDLQKFYKGAKTVAIVGGIAAVAVTAVCVTAAIMVIHDHCGSSRCDNSASLAGLGSGMDYSPLPDNWR